MRKNIVPTLLLVIFVSSLILSACKTATPDAASLEETLQAGVAKTLTAAPTATPLPTATSTSTPTVTPTSAPVVYGPTDFPEDVNPLTGLKVADPSVLNRRPVMVKVANQIAARPHYGLSAADMVFDYATGEGGDRFIGLFYSQDAKQVGTVRSGRFIDIPLVQMYQGILAMVSADTSTVVGGQTELGEILQSLGSRVINTEHCNANTQALCRIGGNTETTAFANTAEMTKLYQTRDPDANARQNLDGMAFDSSPAAGGVAANEFTVHYGNDNDHQWKYDAASKKYIQWTELRDAGGNVQLSMLTDKTNDQQIAFSNVVVVFAEITVLNGDADTMHRYRFTNKGGRALIVRDGQLYDVFYKYTWNQPISFYDADGNPFPLQPGNTWMHVVGLNSKVEEQPTGIWMVSLRMP